ncbi:MAG: N-acetyltransferase, partial [Pseudomonadota bacterium]
MSCPPHEIPVPGPAADFAARLRAALPRHETDRLVMRAPRLEDFAIYWEIYSRRDSAWVVDDPSRTGAWLDFAQMAGGWLLRGHGAWAVETRGGETVGFVLVGL